MSIYISRYEKIKLFIDIYLDKIHHIKNNAHMEDSKRKIGIIKETILEMVPAKYIYLFGSHAYGEPREDSDIDIYLVTPDDVECSTWLYADIMLELSKHEIYFVDLLLKPESVFNVRKENNILENTIVNKGILLHVS